MTRLYMVRHCEAMGNFERVFQGFSDCDVTENGFRQLERLSERFKNIHLDAVYSSPLKRAMKTADAVNRYHGLPVRTEEGLMEINGGHWEGKKWADFPKLYPDEARAWNLAPWEFHPKDGEAMTSVYRRMSETVYKIATENPGADVAVASHGCAIRNLLCWAHGWEIERLNDVEWADNTAVAIIEFDRDFKPTVVLENDASHIDESMSTFATQTWWRKENRNKINVD